MSDPMDGHLQPVLSDDEIRALDDATHFHESLDWTLRFARAVEQRVLAALAACAEPVAWQHKTHADGKWLTTDMDPEAAREWNTVAESRPLYAAPPASPFDASLTQPTDSQGESNAAGVHMGPLCTAHGPVRYQRVTPTQAQRNAAGASPLSQIGDMVLAWVNEGDLYRAAPPAMPQGAREAMRAAADWLTSERINDWRYMEGIAFYEDARKHADALRAALGEGE